MNTEGKTMETAQNIVDFSDLDDFDSIPADAPAKAEGPTMLEAGAEWRAAQGDNLPRQRTKKPGARDVPRDALRFEPCRKCRGTGIYTGYGYRGSKCFPCNGTGNGLSVASAKGRERAAQRKANMAAAAAKTAQDWRDAHPDVVAWWTANPNFEFANNLRAAQEKVGSLTDNQMAAVRKCIDGQKARDEARAAERAARVVDVAGAGFDRLLTAFATASRNGLKHPALVFDAVCFKPAKKYPGSLYVTAGKAYGSDYYGRVDGSGKYDPTRNTPAEVVELVKAIGADPFAQAVAYGKRTGMCCCCGRELTNPESIELGIGPICRDKWGM